jgi:hypothetical protein
MNRDDVAQQFAEANECRLRIADRDGWKFANVVIDGERLKQLAEWIRGVSR